MKHQRWMVLFPILILAQITLCLANDKVSVQLAKCTDGDTAHFMIHGEDRTVRFLAVDTPEYTKEKEPYGKEASEFTCQMLKEADTIELEYDSGSDAQDKYGRELAWIYVDGQLLQRLLVEQGLAEVAYIYGDYAYTDELYAAQEKAQAQGIGMWSDASDTAQSDVFAWLVTVIGTGVIVALSLSRTKGKQRKIKRVKQVMKQITKR